MRIRRRKLIHPAQLLQLAIHPDKKIHAVKYIVIKSDTRCLFLLDCFPFISLVCTPPDPDLYPVINLVAVYVAQAN
jgi:hypothetical protein